MDSNSLEVSNSFDSEFLEYNYSDYESELEENDRINAVTWREIKRMNSPTWLETYNMRSGPQNHSLTSQSPPINFFNLLFSEDLIESIRIWTNARASDKIDNRKRKRRSKPADATVAHDPDFNLVRVCTASGYNFRVRTFSQNNKLQILSGVVKEKVNIPIAIAEYNKNMGGVDLFDQKALYYSIQLTSRRWYMKIFFHFIEIAFINSYVIYQHTYKAGSQPFLSHLAYRKEVIKDLIGPSRSENMSLKIEEISKKRKSSKDLCRDNIEDCFLEEIPPNPLRETNRYKCEVHESNDVLGRIAQTRFWCGTCKIPVCILKCYDQHRQILKQKKIKLTK